MFFTSMLYVMSRWTWWLVPMPFSAAIFIYDEV